MLHGTPLFLHAANKCLTSKKKKKKKKKKTFTFFLPFGVLSGHEIKTRLDILVYAQLLMGILRALLLLIL
jgi:hypothetical protein